MLIKMKKDRMVNLNQLSCLVFILGSINCWRLGNFGFNFKKPTGLIPIMKPSIYSIESMYECSSDLIARLHRFKFVQTINKKCNEVSGEIQTYNLTAFFRYETQEQRFSVNATTFIDDYKGMRIMASDGIIDSNSLYCGGDRIVMIEVELPKIGNCNIGIFEQESLIAFARIRGKCDSFCPGKVSIHYIIPLTNS